MGILVSTVHNLPGLSSAPIMILNLESGHSSCTVTVLVNLDLFVVRMERRGAADEMEEPEAQARAIIIPFSGTDSQLPPGALVVEPEEVIALLDARIAKIKAPRTTCPNQMHFPEFKRSVDSDLAASRLATSPTSRPTVSSPSDCGSNSDPGLHCLGGTITPGHSRFCACHLCATCSSSGPQNGRMIAGSEGQQPFDTSLSAIFVDGADAGPDKDLILASASPPESPGHTPGKPGAFA